MTDALAGVIRRTLLHVDVEAAHPSLNECVIESAQAFELVGQCESQHHVGARFDGQMQVRLLGDADAFRIDDDELGTASPAPI